MNAFYFGSSASRLFGIYSPARASSRRAVLICGPWGAEYLYAHQSVRLLSQLMADAGMHVLRFDWLGDGDSDGDGGASPKLAQQLDDVECAIDELRSVSQARTIALVGLRDGSAPAIHRAAEDKRVDRIALCDPVFDSSSPELRLPRTLVLGNESFASEHQERAALIRSLADQVEDELYSGPLFWQGDGDFGARGMPVAALRRIAEWIA